MTPDEVRDRKRAAVANMLKQRGIIIDDRSQGDYYWIDRLIDSVDFLEMAKIVRRFQQASNEKILQQVRSGQPR